MRTVEKYHILTSPITDEVFIGTIKKNSGTEHVISENKVSRTSEFNTAIISLYENCNWKLTSKKRTFHCCVIDDKTLEKYKDKTLKEFFEKRRNKNGNV